MRLLISCLIWAWTISTVNAAPPLEAYGGLPNVDDMVISPDGTRVAYFRRDGETTMVLLTDLKDGVIGAINADEVKARGLQFFDENTLLIFTSETTRRFTIEKYEFSAAYAYDIERNKIRLLGKNLEDLYPAQTGLGQIVGRGDGGQKLFMPAFMGSLGTDPTYDLISVDMKSRRERVHQKGTQHTIDWIVDTEGTVLAREEFIENRDIYRIRSKRNGNWETVYERKTKFIPFGLMGYMPDGSGLVVANRRGNSDFTSISKLNFDGEIEENLFSRKDRSIEAVYNDLNRKIIGVRYSGQTPAYAFLDPALDAGMETLVRQNKGLSVDIIDFSLDLKRVLIVISGARSTPRYFIYEPAKNLLSGVAQKYKEIGDTDVGNVIAIRYKAEDGLSIPAIITFPPGKGPKESLPMVALPHGGPASYDSMRFDWLAQFLASRGYLVFQPNFRGSTGYGKSFQDAGDGEWGGKMQDDITDGVNLLVRQGWADPDRVCIVGASYGGYAALAGGMLTPDHYKCVVAIAPVSDLIRMLNDSKSDDGRNSTTYRYWSIVIGDRKDDREKLKEVSPALNAEKFKAPVLILHGIDDTVVPYSQGKRMETALKKAGKEVRLVKLKNEDHWLSQPETRLQALRELEAFLSTHIGE
ncbi:MAG: S9 family peptidase [Pseudomonadota bacterium]